MNLQDRIERSKARAEAYEKAAKALYTDTDPKTFIGHSAYQYVATELMKKSRFYTDQAKQMESMG